VNVSEAHNMLKTNLGFVLSFVEQPMTHSLMSCFWGKRVQRRWTAFYCFSFWRWRSEIAIEALWISLGVWLRARILLGQCRA